jgi:hypothetical protein
MGLHATKKHLRNKINGHQIEETIHRMEKIFASCTPDKGLMIRIFRELKGLNSP